jgi:sugar transferase (PEP-CTERM/EpsH1 system associated)
MPELLYLVHRIPYPPNKGDKIRSYHLLKHLAKSYRVHVGAFVDDTNDWQYAEALKQLAGGEIKLLPLHSRRATVKSALGLLTGEPLTLPYYRQRGMQAWVDQLLATRPIQHAVVYSSSMAQYIMNRPALRRVIDFVDIDSDKWRQYADKKSWPMCMVYRRESRKLFDYERRVTHTFDAACFVSDAEADLFKQLAPDCASKVFGYSNGVDTEFFSPDNAGVSPYPAGKRVMVFTGAMDYWANVDAVRWFVQDIFPAIRAQQPDVNFYIVGARPSAEVQALADETNVVVTGAVPDTRPYIAHAALAVAPLRIARGIQNKVLEAMAMAKPTVVSPEALEGINATPDTELLVARDGQAFAAHCLALLAGEAAAIGQQARMRVLADYSWDHHLAGVDHALERHTVLRDTQHFVNLEERHA